MRMNGRDRSVGVTRMVKPEAWGKSLLNKPVDAWLDVAV